MAIKFCLYYHSPETRDYLKSVIQSSSQTLLVETQDLEHLPARVNSGAHVIFLEYQTDRPDLDQWIKQTAADPRNPYIYLFLQEISTEQLWKALRFGVKECFSPPIRPEDFQEALDRLPQLFPEAETAGAASITTLLGCKGGVGTTFLTVNLAYLLAQEADGQVLAVDLDLRYGQMVYFLDVKPQYTLTEVIENVDHLDASYLQSLFYQYDKNYQLLPAPTRLEEAEAVTPETLGKVLRFIKQLPGYRHILVDTGHHLDEITIKAVEMADQLILVTNQTIPALSNAKRLLEILDLLGFGHIPLEVWLNCWHKKTDLRLEDVGKFLGREVSGTLSFAPTEVGASINEGVPLTKSAPGLGVCQDLRALAARFRKDPEAPETRPGRWNWRRLLRRK
jgi:pilus assembly protein CpaE